MLRVADDRHPHAQRPERLRHLPGAVRQGRRPARLDPSGGPGRTAAAVRPGPGAGEPDRSATRSSCNPASICRWTWPGRRCCWRSIPLKDCITFPGIKDGSLFQKNVRQSLGLSNAVNKGIKATIYDNGSDFFFSHNGITAICNQMNLADDGTFKIRGSEHRQRLPVAQYDPVVQREGQDARQRIHHVPLLRDSAAGPGRPDQRLDQLAKPGQAQGLAEQ